MKRRLLPVLAGLLLAGGCAALHGAEQVDVMRLAPIAAAPAHRRIAGSVVVDPVAATGYPASRRYTYLLESDPLLLRQAATLFWEVAPPDTITAALRAALTPRVTGAATPLRHLSARLVRFEEVSGSAGARAVVALEVELAQTGSPTSAARYCRATPIAQPGSGGRAAAFQEDVGALAARVADDAAAGILHDVAC